MDDEQAATERGARERLLAGGAAGLDRRPWQAGRQPPSAVDLVQHLLWRSNGPRRGAPVERDDLRAALRLVARRPRRGGPARDGAAVRGPVRAVSPGARSPTASACARRRPASSGSSDCSRGPATTGDRPRLDPRPARAARRPAPRAWPTPPRPQRVSTSTSTPPRSGCSTRRRTAGSPGRSSRAAAGGRSPRPGACRTRASWPTSSPWRARRPGSAACTPPSSR